MDIGEIAGQAQKFVAENGDKVADAVDTVTDVVDDKTGGKFSEPLAQVDKAARDFLDKK